MRTTQSINGEVGTHPFHANHVSQIHSGFSLQSLTHLRPVYELSSTACVHEISPGQATTSFRAHNPWKITWEASDLTNLGPSPPNLDLPCGWSTELSTWIPGSTVDPSFISRQDECASIMNTNNPPSRPRPSNMNDNANFRVVGLPVIGSLALFGFIVWFCCYWSQRRRDKRRAVQAPHQGDVAGAGGQTAGEENPPPYEMDTRNDTNPPPYTAGRGER